MVWNGVPALKSSRICQEREQNPFVYQCEHIFAFLVKTYFEEHLITYNKTVIIM